MPFETYKNYKRLDTTPTETGGQALNDNATRTADDVETLTTAVAAKASQTAVDALTTTVGTKAPQAELDALEGVVDAKADKALPAVVGNVATLDAFGNLTDGGVTLASKANATTVSSHIAATEAHGATGAVVGTTNTQTLTNKTISGASNTLSNIPQSSVTNLVTDLATVNGNLSSHTSDATIHRSINDATTTTTNLWSASKISSVVSGYALTSHTHNATDITSGTLLDARLSSNVPLKNAANTFTATNTFGSVIANDITCPTYQTAKPATVGVGTGTAATAISVLGGTGGDTTAVGGIGGAGASISIMGGIGGVGPENAAGSAGGNVLLRGGYGGGTLDPSNGSVGDSEGKVVVLYPDDTDAIRVTQGEGKLIASGYTSVDFFGRTLVDNGGYAAIQYGSRLLYSALGVAQFGFGAAPTFYQQGLTPNVPGSSTEVRMYMKGTKLIFQYYDAGTGTVRYKYLELSGTGTTWTHTTTAP